MSSWDWALLVAGIWIVVMIIATFVFSGWIFFRDRGE